MDRAPRRSGWWLFALGLAACGPGPASEPATTREPAPTREPGPRETWLKGQLHAHTGNSGDSQTPPADALRWYAAHGFDFVVITDHNFVTVVEGGPVLAIPGVELTQNLADCVPPPEPGLHCLLHINALFVDPRRAGRFGFPETAERGRQALYGRGLAAARELGGVAQLNHPNFHHAADGPMIAALAGEGLQLLEVANLAVDSNNAGDAAHPSTEALWDEALGRGARVFAVATDDAHHYDDAAAVRARGEAVYVGDRGYVMVRAVNEPAAIRAAIERGDFYASSGVRLTSLTAAGGTLTITTDTEHEVRFIGLGGRVLAQHTGDRAAFTLAADSGPHVRAVVTAPDGRQAWTQPLWRE